MLVVSLISALESAAAAAESPTLHNLSGAIKDFSKFFRPEVIGQLDRQYSGVFAFLAFHPGNDRPVTDYVLEGTLGSDIGADVLALFIADKNARWPTPVSKVVAIPGLDVDDAEHASFGLVRNAFPGKLTQPLPGVVFLERLAKPVEPVYVTLGDCGSVEGTRKAMRLLGGIVSVNVASKTFERPFSDRFAADLAKHNLKYTRGGSMSGSEWLYKSFNAIKPYKKDIVAFAGKTITAGLLGNSKSAGDG